MKKTSLKKLTLSRETLRYLNAEQTRAALGGTLVGDASPIPTLEPIPLTGDSKRECCV